MFDEDEYYGTEEKTPTPSIAAVVIVGVLVVASVYLLDALLYG